MFIFLLTDHREQDSNEFCSSPSGWQTWLQHMEIKVEVVVVESRSLKIFWPWHLIILLLFYSLTKTVSYIYTPGQNAQLRLFIYWHLIFFSFTLYFKWSDPHEQKDSWCHTQHAVFYESSTIWTLHAGAMGQFWSCCAFRAVLLPAMVVLSMFLFTLAASHLLWHWVSLPGQEQLSE